MPVARDADPWVRPPVGESATSSRYGVVRTGPGPQEDYSFSDLLDILNPLQHIPLVSSFYRELTGDEIKPSAQIAGSTLYGGPIGFLVATNMTVVQEALGESPADLLVASLIGTDESDFSGEVDAVAAAVSAEDMDMPLPASGDAAHERAAQARQAHWPWTRRNEYAELAETRDSGATWTRQPDRSEPAALRGEPLDGPSKEEQAALSFRVHA